MLKVVVDTDIFIRAIYHGDSHSQSVLRLISAGRLSMLLSKPIKAEIQRMTVAHPVVADLRFFDASAALLKVDRLLGKATLIRATKTFTQCEDPDDNMFFDCAIAGQADCIVAIDQHIHAVVDPPVPVRTPWQFLQDNSQLLKR